jgi:hypothetical protein
VVITNHQHLIPRDIIRTVTTVRKTAGAATSSGVTAVQANG